MARLSGVDVTVFSIGGSSVLADLRGAEIVSRTDFADVTPVVLAGESREGVKQRVEIKGALTSTKASGSKVTHLDVSALALGGLGFRSVIEQCVFEGQLALEDGSGLGDEWEYPVVVRKDYRARLEMLVDSSGAPSLTGSAFGSLAGKSLEFGVTINGVVVTVPMKLARFEHVIRPGERQKWRLDLVGSAMVGAAYPAAPAGSSTLLAHAFNSPGAALAISADAGVGQPLISGSFLVKGFGFRVDRASAVESTYDFVSSGPVVLA
jgi:hypothetical protein